MDSPHDNLLNIWLFDTLGSSEKGKRATVRQGEIR